MFNSFKGKRGLEQGKIGEQSKPEIKIAEKTNYKKPIQEIEDKIEDKRIIDALKNVKDPELDIDIWSLELIYDIDIRDKNIDIKMTFTSPFCPYGPELIQQVKDRLNELVYETKIELVFSPPWNPSKQVKEILGIA